MPRQTPKPLGTAGEVAVVGKRSAGSRRDRETRPWSENAAPGPLRGAGVDRGRKTQRRKPYGITKPARGRKTQHWRPADEHRRAESTDAGARGGGSRRRGAGRARAVHHPLRRAEHRLPDQRHADHRGHPGGVAADRARYPQSRSALLPMLHLVQSVEGRITPAGIEVCAQILNISTADVSGVATFYTMYKRRPNGRYAVGVCTTALCAVVGGDEVYSALQDHLGIGGDETTEDGAITLEHVECNAACDFAPVMMVNWEFFDNMTPQKAIDVVDRLRAGEEVTATRGARVVHLERGRARAGRLPRRSRRRGSDLRPTHRPGPEDRQGERLDSTAGTERQSPDSTAAGASRPLDRLEEHLRQARALRQAQGSTC